MYNGGTPSGTSWRASATTVELPFAHGTPWPLFLCVSPPVTVRCRANCVDICGINVAIGCSEQEEKGTSGADADGLATESQIIGRLEDASGSLVI
jgi:hypothetical protein